MAFQKRIIFRGIIFLFLGLIFGIIGSFLVVKRIPKNQNLYIPEKTVNCINDDSPIFSLLFKPKRILPSHEIRLRLPQWLSLSGLGKREIFSFEKISPERYRLKVGDHHVPGRLINDSIPASFHVLNTSIGRIYMLLWEPKEKVEIDRACIFQHGHRGMRDFGNEFKESILAMIKKGHPVILPCLPHMGFDCDEIQVTHKLYLLGLNLMGVRVAQEQLIIEWISQKYPEAKITFVGHSAGSMVGYFTSAVCEQIHAIACDYFSFPDSLYMQPMHCESIPGLYHLFDRDGIPSINIMTAKSIHLQSYGYPDREALESWAKSPAEGIHVVENPSEGRTENRWDRALTSIKSEFALKN